MSRESEFFIYLLEGYAEWKNAAANGVLEQWDRLGMTDGVYERYGTYRSERLEKVFEDIDRMAEERAEANG